MNTLPVFVLAGMLFSTRKVCYVAFQVARFHRSHLSQKNTNEYCFCNVLLAFNHQCFGFLWFGGGGAGKPGDADAGGKSDGCANACSDANGDTYADSYSNTQTQTDGAANAASGCDVATNS